MLWLAKLTKYLTVIGRVAVSWQIFIGLSHYSGSLVKICPNITASDSDLFCTCKWTPSATYLRPTSTFIIIIIIIIYLLKIVIDNSWQCLYSRAGQKGTECSNNCPKRYIQYSHVIRTYRPTMHWHNWGAKTAAMLNWVFKIVLPSISQISRKRAKKYVGKLHTLPSCYLVKQSNWCLLVVGEILKHDATILCVL